LWIIEGILLGERVVLALPSILDLLELRDTNIDIVSFNLKRLGLVNLSPYPGEKSLNIGKRRDNGNGWNDLLFFRSLLGVTK